MVIFKTCQRQLVLYKWRVDRSREDTVTLSREERGKMLPLNYILRGLKGFFFLGLSVSCLLEPERAANEPLRNRTTSHWWNGGRSDTEAPPMTNSRGCGFCAREMQLGFQNPNRKPAHSPARLLMRGEGERREAVANRGKHEGSLKHGCVLVIRNWVMYIRGLLRTITYLTHSLLAVVKCQVGLSLAQQSQSLAVWTSERLPHTCCSVLRRLWQFCTRPWERLIKTTEVVIKTSSQLL